MKRISKIALRCILFVLAGIVHVQMPAAEANPLVDDGQQFIVTVSADTAARENDDTLRRLVEAAGARVEGVIGDFRPFPKILVIRPLSRIEGIRSNILAARIGSSRIPVFTDMRPDYLYTPQQASVTPVPNDPFFPQQAHLGQMQVIRAQQLAARRRTQFAAVALLDNCAPGFTRRGDLEGRIDGRGFDATEDRSSPIPMVGLADPHAAHMASIIAGVYNISSDRVIRESSIMRGIRYCATSGTKIAYVAVNPGFQNTVPASPIASLEQYVSIYGTAFGGVAFFPSGNDSRANSRALPNAMAVVSSCDAVGVRSRFSNFGTTETLLAPGENIRTTGPAGSPVLVSGTSAAAANAAGMASLALSLTSVFSVLPGTQIHDAMKLRDANGRTTRIDAVQLLRRLGYIQ
jgi:subtilisin family serine protease